MSFIFKFYRYSSIGLSFSNQTLDSQPSMKSRFHFILKIFSCFLFLAIQLAAGLTCLWSNYHQYVDDLEEDEFYQISHTSKHEQPTSFTALLHSSWNSKDRFHDVKPIQDQLHVKYPKKSKLNYFLSALNQQYNLAARLVIIFSDRFNRDIFLTENKRGEYSRHNSFLPAYYNFLFRLYPF
ncbi:hypothetical protein COR50_14745 [Chitinophaga caeni]|uniref:Uncharacterized protein n=1 Tax=Chitinophaga caeni TaxID=2029983 RepID=A0A291QWR2_9BACT|nr:hypothetical protein [Chitinophaga caeni]ATL48322.1 hypothetical protein COR50_14745 [Chitinophaga caeni]